MRMLQGPLLAGLQGVEQAVVNGSLDKRVRLGYLRRPCKIPCVWSRTTDGAEFLLVLQP